METDLRVDIGVATDTDPPTEGEKILHGFLPWEVKVDDDGPGFEGLAATWDLDLGGDVIHKGAFKKWIQEFKQLGKLLPLLDSHDTWSSVTNVLGKLLEAKETKAGLWTRWELVDAPDLDGIKARLAGGFVPGMSIGYVAKKIRTPSDVERRGGILRHLDEMALREVSLVVTPMNPKATVNPDTVKGEAEEPNTEDPDTTKDGAAIASHTQATRLNVGVGLLKLRRAATRRKLLASTHDQELKP